MPLKKDFSDLRLSFEPLTLYQKFEQVCVLMLTTLIAIIIALALWNLTLKILLSIWATNFDPTDYGVFQTVFGMIFTVIIALEFKRSLLVVAERRHSVVQVRSVILIALLAVVRKLIILDLSSTDAFHLLALAAAILALGAVYWLVRDQGQPRGIDLDKYLTDQLQLAKDGRFDSQRGGMSRKKNGEWSFAIEVGKFFSPPDEPDLASLESGLQFDFATAPMRMTYQDYLFRFEARNAAALSNKASRMFITMWLPASAAKDYLSNIFALPPDVAGLPRVAESERFGFNPLNTRRFTRPMFKVPDEDWAFSVWLFRSAPVGDQAALAAMMASNRELLAKMTAVGGKRYSPYSGVMSSDEWAAHFGPELWRRLSEAKKKFDPNNVLTPGAGIFA